MTWTARYIGVPFVYGGRERQHGFDCWGLVRAVYAEALEIDLPAHDDVEASDMRSVARIIGRERDSGPWREVFLPQTFDVVLMGLHGRRWPAHVGVFVGGDMVLHTEESCHSCLVRLGHPTLRERVIGFRRHAALVGN